MTTPVTVPPLVRITPPLLAQAPQEAGNLGQGDQLTRCFADTAAVSQRLDPSFLIGSNQQQVKANCTVPQIDL